MLSILFLSASAMLTTAPAHAEPKVLVVAAKAEGIYKNRTPKQARIDVVLDGVVAVKQACHDLGGKTKGIKAAAEEAYLSPDTKCERVDVLKKGESPDKPGNFNCVAFVAVACVIPDKDQGVYLIKAADDLAPSKTVTTPAAPGSKTNSDDSEEIPAF